MLNSPLSPWPSFTQEEIEAVQSVLQSNRVNYWTGQEGRDFEREFAAWCGSAHAISLANGTLALDLALKALGIGHGDEVIVTPRSFLASTSTVVNAGATPIFADVDPESGNITAASIEAVMTDRTRAVIPVHLGGWPCDMAPIMALGIKVIEDCAQAHGAKVGNRNVGSIGDVGAWSFCQDKILTTGGEGGMVTTGDPDLWSAMWSYKDHGKSWEAVYERNHPQGFRWVHESFGTNWRMLEIQAAIGRIQLRRLADWTERRTVIANRIRGALSPFAGGIRVPQIPDGFQHAYYRQYAYVRPDGLKKGWSRDRFVAECNARGIPVFHGSCPEIYLEKAFDGTPWRPAERLPVAKDLGETSLMFLCHPTLTDEEIDRTCSVISEVADQAVA